MTGFGGNADHRSSRLKGTAEVKNSRKAWGIHPVSDRNLGNQRNSTRETSLDSQRSVIDYDNCPVVFSRRFMK